MKMSKARIALAFTVMALVPVVSFGQTAAGGGLAGTVHDFTSPNSPASSTNAQPIGMCTFCHTPHKGASTKLLWNHTLSANSFSWSDATTTTGGTTLPTIAPTYQGASVRCLSCHDGSVAIGDVSWFKEQAWPGGAGLNTAMMGTGALVGAPPSPANEFVIGAGGNLAGNHPIAIPFPWGNTPSTYNGNTTGTGVILTEWQPDPQTSGIRLFNDAGAGAISAGAVVGRTGIECSSCHDPHNGVTVPPTSDFFLRGNFTGNDSNYLCTKCHKK
jgi:hypothetical protein